MGIIYKKKEGSPGVLNAEEAERGTVLKLIKEDNPDGELSVFRNLRRATISFGKEKKKLLRIYSKLLLFLYTYLYIYTQLLSL